jgi:hypothetical protein
VRARGDLFHEHRFDQIVLQGHLDEGPDQLLDIAVADQLLTGVAIIAADYPLALVAMRNDALDQFQHVRVVPPHSFDGFLPDCWHTVISLLRNRAMWRVAPGFVPV